MRDGGHHLFLVAAASRVVLFYALRVACERRALPLVTPFPNDLYAVGEIAVTPYGSYEIMKLEVHFNLGFCCLIFFSILYSFCLRDSILSFCYSLLSAYSFSCGPFFCSSSP